MNGSALECSVAPLSVQLTQSVLIPCGARGLGRRVIHTRGRTGELSTSGVRGWRPLQRSAMLAAAAGILGAPGPIEAFELGTRRHAVHLPVAC